MKTLFLILMVVSSLCGTEIAPVSDIEYWDSGASVVYVKVVGFEKSDSQDKIVLQPLATLSGNFKSEDHQIFTASTWLENALGSVFLKRPVVGTKLIALIYHENVGKDDYYGIPCANVACFPRDDEHLQPGFPSLFAVSGFEDEKVIATIEKIRALRSKQRDDASKSSKQRKRPDETTQKSTQDHGDQQIVIMAQVANYDGADNGSANIVLKPVATLAGAFDSAWIGEIKATMNVGGKSEIQERPAMGAKVLVVVDRDEKGKYTITDQPVLYFPEDHGKHPAIYELVNFDDKAILETVSTLKKLRAERHDSDDKNSALETNGLDSKSKP